MDEAINKLRWRCRRGTLELDLMLRRYLDQRYATDTPEQQAAFLQLLAMEDSDLMRYLMGERQPDDVTVAELVMCIRALRVG